MASIIAGDGAAAAGLPTLEEVARDRTVCQNHTYLEHDALWQAYLPTREGDLGLTSSSSVEGAAYIGYHVLVLGRVVAASARGNLPSLLERMPERSVASALNEELKIVTSEAKRSQIEDAVGSSWPALAAEEGPQGRGIGTLLVEPRGRGGGGGGGGRVRGGGKRGGAGGGCVEQREQWVNPLASKPDKETELSQTNQATGGVWVGVVPCVLKALARPPRAPWETTLARSPNPGKCGNEESYGKIQGRAGERHHYICGMPGGLAKRHDEGLPVEGDLRQEHGAA